MAHPSAQARADAAADGMSLALWARVVGHEAAVISPSGDRTFSELNANANRLVRALGQRGIGPGDSVAILCRNRPEMVETVQACLRGGLRWTPINWHLRASEIAHVCNDSGTAALIADAALGDLGPEVAARCESLGVRVAVGSDEQHPCPHGFEAWESVLADHDGADIEDPSPGNRMLYTSGTTGHPKGVVRPTNYSTGLKAITEAPQYSAGTGQRNLCTGPLHHGGPMSFSLLAPLASGVGTVLMERWDAAEALQLIERYSITHTHMVPTMFHRLLRLPDEVRHGADVSSLTYVLHGAAPCPAEVKAGMLNWFGPVIWEYYAATEGAAASIGPGEWLEHPGSVGRPPTPGHVRIVDEAGTALPAGEAGEIQIARVDGADFEYLNDPLKTKRARRGEYFTVGDVGYLDDDGYLFVTDRSDDLVIRGGVNIYPAEVEAVLLTHPSVADAAVVGAPDEEWGERVVAVVQPSNHTGAEDTGRQLKKELAEHCAAHLARFKCPSEIRFTAELPRGDNGKLHRRDVRSVVRNSPVLPEDVDQV